MMRRLVLLLICGLAVTCAQVQTPSPADRLEQGIVAEKLSAKDPSQVAWGAYLAANYQQKKFIPEIIQLLAAENNFVRRAAIDSLIRLDAALPENTLTTLIKDYLEPVLILVSTHADRYSEFLLRLLDKPMPDWDWVAVNSILAAAPPPGYAARLLKDW